MTDRFRITVHSLSGQCASGYHSVPFQNNASYIIAASVATVSYTPTVPLPDTALNLVFNLRFNATLYHRLTRLPLLLPLLSRRPYGYKAIALYITRLPTHSNHPFKLLSNQLSNPLSNSPSQSTFSPLSHPFLTHPLTYHLPHLPPATATYWPSQSRTSPTTPQTTTRATTTSGMGTRCPPTPPPPSRSPRCTTTRITGKPLYSNYPPC